MKLEPAEQESCLALMSWLSSADQCTQWASPRLGWPYTRQSFFDSIQFNQGTSTDRLGGEQVYSYACFSQLRELRELQAFGQFYLKQGRTHLARIIIAPDQRGKGLAKHLVKALLLKGSKELRTHECSLFVAEANVPAINCYLSLGFEFASWPPDHDMQQDVLFMVNSTVS